MTGADAVLAAVGLVLIAKLSRGFARTLRQSGPLAIAWLAVVILVVLFFVLRIPGELLALLG